MCGAPVREGRVTVVITAPIHRVVWACIDPVLRQSALLDVSPRPTKGWPREPLGPWAFREVFYPSGGPRGYLSPTSPQFWNNRLKDPRSSWQSLILPRNTLKISLPGRYFWTLSDPVKTIFYCLFHYYSLKFGVLSQVHASEVSILHCRTLMFIGCTQWV
jgi:hypothetical protein